MGGYLKCSATHNAIQMQQVQLRHIFAWWVIRHFSRSCSRVRHRSAQNRPQTSPYVFLSTFLCDACAIVSYHVERHSTMSMCVYVSHVDWSRFFHLQSDTASDSDKVTDHDDKSSFDSTNNAVCWMRTLNPVTALAFWYTFTTVHLVCCAESPFPLKPSVPMSVLNVLC